MTPGTEPVVVDTNILFSALLRTESAFRRVLIRSEREFLICETTLAELFRRKEKLVRGTRMDDEALTLSYYLLLKRVQLFRESQIPEACWVRARELCAGVDDDDAPQVAVTLALDGLLWTGDRALKGRTAREGLRPLLHLLMRSGLPHRRNDGGNQVRRSAGAGSMAASVSDRRGWG